MTESTTPAIEVMKAVLSPRKKVSSFEKSSSTFPVRRIPDIPLEKPKNVPKIPKPTKLPGRIFTNAEIGKSGKTCRRYASGLL